jgi:hypothetical protein
MNRGNDRRQVFHDAQDYGQFVALIGQSCRRFSRPAVQTKEGIGKVECPHFLEVGLRKAPND